MPKPKKRTLKQMVGPVKAPKKYSRDDREKLTEWEYENGTVELQKDGTYKWTPSR
jgi:hypothetical protein